MKTLFTTLIALGVLAFGTAASAVTITPDDCVMGSCWTGEFEGTPSGTGTGRGNVNLDADDIASMLSLTNVVEAYKADQVDNDVADESGAFAVSYSTVFSNTPNDPSTATVTFDGGDIIGCANCFALIKDGNNNPYWYLFSIAGWNGTDELAFTNFWTDNGAISHVSIFTADGSRQCTPETCPPAVPIPAAVWLFGSGLIGLVAVGRRKV